MNIPSDLRYTSHDEWVRIEGDLLTVGITDFAQDQLGDIVHVELPAIGKKVNREQVVCELESVKAVAEIYAPAAGEVVEVNKALEDATDTINRDPYGSWIYKLKVSAAPTDLLDAAAYKAKVG
jgi:glycine cleavage system H protein